MEYRRRAWSWMIAAALCGGALAPPSRAANLTLLWTAPGDDGVNGRATRYELRYSLAPITEASYATAWRVNGLPLPQPAGAPERVAVPNLVAGRKYYFALKSMDDAGNWSPISNVVQTAPSVTATGDTPASLVFSLPMPNPAPDEARWLYGLPVPGSLSVGIYDISGRLVRELSTGLKPAGSGQLVWDLADASGRRVAAGLYLVRARSAGRDWVQRLVVTR